VSLEEEWVRLVVHGTLHVLGMDHPDDPEERDSSPMYRRQEALVREVMGGAARPARIEPPR
jgi:ssRNA-specific RNase YbeY (16S rRNA maturation enzyme)